MKGTDHALSYGVASDQENPVWPRMWLFIAIAVLIKVCLLTLVLPTVLDRLGSNYHTEMFPDYYDLIAQNWIHGLGYRVYPETSLTILRSPGFPIVLAGIFAVFGKSLLAVQLIQLVMSICTAVLVYLISRQSQLTHWISAVAAALFLFHPVTMLTETRGGDDATFTLFCAITLWLLLRCINTSLLRYFIALGIVFGYTMLIKASVALTLPAAVIFLLFWPGSGFRPAILVRNFAIVGALAGLVMAPWVVRNYAIAGKFIPTMTVGGLALFQGVEVVKHDNSGKSHLDLLEDAGLKQLQIAHELNLRTKLDFFPQFYDVHDEVRFYSELGQRAWHDYRSSPALLMKAIAHNSWAFWSQGRSKTATRLNLIFMIPFLLVSAYGATIFVRLDWKNWLLPIFLVAFMAPNLVIIAVDRHCSSVIPIMSVFAASVLLNNAVQSYLTRKMHKSAWVRRLIGPHAADHPLPQRKQQPASG